MTDRKTGRLLVVEDDDILRERLARSMRRRGFDTVTAAGLAEALDLIAQDPPDFAVVDLRLLDGSGLDAIGALEKRNPKARAIILTGYGDIPTAVSAARIGAIDYITKPATAEEIIDALTAPRKGSAPPPRNPIPPDEARRAHVARVYRDADANVNRAARLVNLHRRTLQRLLRRPGVTKDAVN